MVAALVRWQFALAAGDAFANAPAERVIGGVSLREGRNVSVLGGPDIPSECSALQLVLNNHDGYYTTGAGMALGPGSRIRLQWRAVAADAWVTRFVGSISELTTGNQDTPIMITRWVGALYRFTSGNIPQRLIINQTPQSIMTVLCDAAGIPAADRQFDTLATLYNRQLSPGYAGVQEMQAMVDGFIYDAPDGKVRLELPATRAAKTVVARYTDGDPTAAELGVPPPRRLTRPFGIINHIDGEYHYYTPASSQAESQTFTFADSTGVLRSAWQTFTRALALDEYTPSENVAISDYSLSVNTGAFTPTAVTIAHPATSGSGEATVSGSTGDIEIRNLAVVVLGNTICLSWEARFTSFPFVSFGVAWLDITVELSEQVSFEQTIQTFQRAAENGASIDLYGYRPRLTPLVIGIYQATLLADDFVPDYAELNTAMQADLDAYATPIPVFAVERACDTADHRADILARRLSDKVHLTADGPSMLGADLDGFVEAIQTTIAPTGELTQTLWIESTGDPPEPPPPPPPPATAFNWRFDTLAAFETYFTVEVGTSNGEWRFDTGGSTASSQTGPGTNNVDPFVHTETSSNSGETALEMNGLAVVLDDASNAVLHDRDIVIRYCMQGAFDLDPLQSLRFQGRTGGGAWTNIASMHGWTYSSQYVDGDSVTDANGDTFTVAQDGGWRDVPISTGDYDEYRLAPDYTGDRILQDIALHSISNA